jgi:hypothetical protein
MYVADTPTCLLVQDGQHKFVPDPGFAALLTLIDSH